MSKQSIGFIGAGQMARALAQGFVAAGLVAAEDILAADPVPAAVEHFCKEVKGAKIAPSNGHVVRGAGLVFLAVKPQSMAQVMAELAAEKADCLFVSIAAGIGLAKLCEGLKSLRVVRVMPNTPALVGFGAAAYATAEKVSSEDSQRVASLLASVGTAHAVQEKLLDAVTGLSGSGPAFIYMLIEALSDGGVRNGLPRDLATALAAQTVLGSAKMVLETGEHPAVLKDRVASPGGTTIAGIQALEEHGFRAGLIAAVTAATQRSKELG